jgi:hypothetical protein
MVLGVSSGYGVVVMNIDEFIILLNTYLDDKLKDVDSAVNMLKLSLFWLIMQNTEYKKAGMLIHELTREEGKDWND